ncbi:Site-specific recombinase XerD [Micromonospora matsumotoense]|uniref:Site-specific recombinase XerD n=1 Tax=Micromonospora matsumotoense TaxID=121616 RepID=A0A1C4ZVT0_9ACTN|nr:site-specific integrase [Micromonospora matsumotoense]SCF37055.1 Site-specific recombinase XerD [Micromonospora matsumotoense]
MGHIIKTPAGTYRANWRDPSGRQKAKTFRTRKEAAAYLAATETTVSQGTYVDPAAGRTRFGTYAERWLASRSVEATTLAGWTSRLRARLLPQWGTWPVARIDHLAVQEWVTRLGRELSPATVASCHSLLSSILASAVRSRLIAFNPCEGVRLPAQRKRAGGQLLLTLAQVTELLLPSVPEWHRPVVAAAAGAGLRWGECLGLRWADIDLPDDDDQAATLTVRRVVIEVNGHPADKPYPKTAQSRRVVPVPPFLRAELGRHRALTNPGAAGRVFTNQAGDPMLRSNFRRQVWRPSLVRAGLLGSVAEDGPHRFRATWHDSERAEWSAEFTTHRDAVAHVAVKAAGGLRFHDLRHGYATWLVSSGVPVNVVQAVMGHEQASTTLNRYTHTPADFHRLVRGVFAPSADDSLTTDDNGRSNEEDEGGGNAP